MIDFSDEFFVESKSAREQGISKLKNQHSEKEILNKVKVLFFAVWQGVGRTSRQQLADFYEVSVNTIDTNYQRHKDEFDSDGVKVFSGADLRDVRFMMSLTSKSPKETIYTPAGALRMGFILRDSEVAKA
ncbi:MAG: DNA-binding protein, partial [Symploca sp. SIO2G7]|nr:DNA-binding protein [Symploca sp. SIO2G7]